MHAINLLASPYPHSIDTKALHSIDIKALHSIDIKALHSSVEAPHSSVAPCSRYKMETANGKVLAGGEAQAMGGPLAYGGQPHEHVAFIGCHDNLTMFDFVSVPATGN